MPGTEAKQRLIQIEVGEISLVTAPANEEPFLLIKSRKPDDGGMLMSTENKKTEEARAPGDAENVAEEKAESGNAEATQTPDLAAINEAVTKLAKVAETLRPQEDGAEEKEEDGPEKQEEVFKSLTEAITDLNQAIAKLSESHTTPSESAPEEEAEEVAKGRPQFTADRTNKILEMFVALQSLVREIAPDAFEGAAEVTTKSEPPVTQKELDAKLAPLTTSIQELTKALSNVQGISKGEPLDDTQENKEEGKSMWGGVFWPTR